jgi:hypothetical protein
MNPVIHLFKKDVRHLLILLALWLLLVLCQAVLIGTGMGAAAGDMVLQVIYSMVSMLIPVLQFIVLVVIVPLLVQDEPLVGTTAFWFTRPVARKDLLAGKSLFIGALLVLPPLLAEIIMLVCNEVTPRHVWLAVPEVLMNQFALILAIWALASLTRTFARFAVAGIVVIIAIWLVEAGIAVAQLLQGDMFLKKVGQYSLFESRGIVSAVVTIVFCGVAVVHQYLTRQTTRTIVIACIAAVADMVVTSAWPVDFLKTPRAPVQHEVLKGETVRVAMDRPNMLFNHDAFSFRSSAAPKKDVSGSLTVSGLPEGLAANVTAVRSKVVYPDGKTITSDGDNLMSHAALFNNQWDTKAISHALGGVSILNKSEHSYHSETLIELDSDVFYKYRETKGVYTADVGLNVYKCEITGVLPLQKKARFDKGSEHVVVSNVLREPRGCSVILSSKTVKLLFAADARADITSMMGGSKALYVLRNQKLGQALVPKQDFNAGNMWMSQSSARLVIQPIRLRYESDKKETSIDEAWLADADLVRVEAVEVGTLSASLRVEDFVLDPPKDKPQRKKSSFKRPSVD